MLILLKTLKKIGLLNLYYFIFYKFLRKTFLLNFFLKKSKTSYGKLFFDTNVHQKNVSNYNKDLIIKCADLVINNNLSFFSFHNIKMDEPPNWFINPFSGIQLSNFKNNWTDINDFNNRSGDIKNIWEPSRFNWIVTLSMAYAVSKDNKYILKTNEWLSSWVKNNPKNIGPNWKCGQEASIRLLNIIIANTILNKNLSDNLIELIKEHLDRISLTTFYAKAQQNNHVISESIALYLGGFILYKNTKQKKYLNYHNKGLKLIEKNIDILVMDDGTFSQYSIIYHRMLLDLLSILELLRTVWGLPIFSKVFYKKVSVAYNWYCEMIDDISFDCPNIGANDGTYILNYCNLKYRDFRPTASFTSSVFNYPLKIELWKNQPLVEIFNLKKPALIKSASKSLFFDKGGFIKLVNKNGSLFFRYPNFKFRPSHSDALHIDIWKEGDNWIRDAGSFSYALEDTELDNFSGTKGHSTIQFDSLNQMPRLTRFLFGKWLKPEIVEFNNEKSIAISSYVDYKKNFHKREIKSHADGWDIFDEISGKFSIAELRFLLKPGNWVVKKNEICQNPFSLKVISDDIQSFEIGSSYFSHHYMEKQMIPELIVKINKPSTIHTLIRFSD